MELNKKTRFRFFFVKSILPWISWTTRQIVASLAIFYYPRLLMHCKWLIIMRAEAICCTDNYPHVSIPYSLFFVVASEGSKFIIFLLLNIYNCFYTLRVFGHFLQPPLSLKIRFSYILIPSSEKKTKYFSPLFVHLICQLLSCHYAKTKIERLTTFGIIV